jgi:hypothetical protein
MRFILTTGWLLAAASVLWWLLTLLVPGLADARHRPRRPDLRANACTHWASPQGAGTTCSQSQPCLLSHWLATQVQPGRTLCLLPGTYTGDQLLQIPATFAGNEQAPIGMVAQPEGSVTFDGQDSKRPCHLRGSYGVFEGFNCTRGDNVTLRFDDASSHLVVRKVLVYDGGEGSDSLVQVAGQHNTIEDCAAWGKGRKVFPAGAAGGEHNTVRRCWGRWEVNTHPQSRPANTAEVGYGQDLVTLENNVLTWDSQGGGTPTEYEGVLQMFATVGSQVLGNILYLPASATYEPPRLLSGLTDGGSHAQQGQFHPATDTVTRYNVVVVDPAHPKFAQLHPWQYSECTTPGCPGGRNNVIRDNVGIAGQPPTYTSSWTPSDNQTGTSVAQAIGANRSVWTESHASPGICAQIVGGQPTTTPLWPWPMNARIKAATGHDVQATLEALLGPIPPQCVRGSTPIPPEPQPEPPVALTCSGEITTVPGPLALHCVPSPARRTP